MNVTQSDLGERNTRIAIRNSAFGLLSLGCRLVGNMVVFIVVARLPGISTLEFGQLTYAVALGSLFVMASQFGLIPLLIRDIAAQPSTLESRTRVILSLRIFLTLLGALASTLYVQNLDISSEGEKVCYIMIASLYVGAFSTDIQAIFQSREKMHLELFGIIVENILLLAFAVASFLFRPTITEVAWGFLIAKGIAFTLNYLICGFRVIWVFPKPSLLQWKKILLQATPFALAGLIAAGVVQVDTILLRELHDQDPESTVGLYQSAVRLFLIPMLLPEIVLKVFLPQLSRMHGISGPGLIKDLGRVNNVLLSLGLLIGIVTIFRGNDIIEFIYGKRYADAGPILQLLGFSIILRFGAAYNLYFTIRDKIWFRVWSALLALTAVVVFDILLIPKYGALGAAYASILSNAVYWVPYLLALHKEEGTITMGWKFMRAAVCAVILSSVLYATAGINIAVMLPAYTAIILGAVFLIMPFEDRMRIISQFRLKGA